MQSPVSLEGDLNFAYKCTALLKLIYRLHEYPIIDQDQNFSIIYNSL